MTKLGESAEPQPQSVPEDVREPPSQPEIKTELSSEVVSRPKRPLTEKQKQALTAGREKRHAKYREMKESQKPTVTDEDIERYLASRKQQQQQTKAASPPPPKEEDEDDLSSYDGHYDSTEDETLEQADFDDTDYTEYTEESEPESEGWYTPENLSPPRRFRGRGKNKEYTTELQERDSSVHFA
jgi:hypothetical protein